MRKAVVLAAAVALALLALWFWTRSGGDADVSARVSTDAGARRDPARLAELLRVGPQAATAGSRGELSGKVLGPGSAGANVALATGKLHRTVVADAEGAFRFEELGPGEYRLDATAGALAAETLGPIPLGPGEQIGGLVLQLVETGGLAGEVLDAQTRAALPGAQLSAGGAAAVTDVDGKFELRGLPPGEATLTVAHPGYVSSATKVAVPRGKRQAGATLLLSPAAHVAGRVEEADGSPVSGAMVFAERYDFGPVAAATVIGTTADDGHFEGDLEPGRVTLRASASTGEARSNELELHAGQASANLRLVIDVGGDIVGQVFEADGTPAPGASVFAVEIESQRASSGASSGPDGRFQLSGLPAGVYAVVARIGARAAQKAGLRIEPGDVAHAEIRFGGASIEGRVVDAANQPLLGAQVSISPEGAATLAATGVESGPEGHFKVEGLSGAQFALKATHPSGVAERHGVAAGAKDVVLRVAAQSEIQGSVNDDEGHAVTDFEVLADPLATQGGATRAQGHFASVNGSFHLSCAPGRYRVRVSATGYAAADAGETEAAAQGSSSEVSVTLHKTRTIVGTVVDGRNQQPIAGAHVATRPNLLYAFGRASPVHAGGWTSTGPDGRFTLADADPGDVTLFASAEGFGWAPPTRVPGSSGGPVQLVLPAGGNNGPEDFAGVGMQLGPDFRITQVFDSGPADLAGIRNGDVLVSIDGQPVAGRQLGDVIGWIRGEVGTSVAVSVTRDGQALTLVPTRAQIKF